MKLAHRSSSKIVFPKALLAELGKVQPSIGNGRILGKMVHADIAGLKTGSGKARKSGGNVATGPSSISIRTFKRLKKAAAALEVPMSDLFRISIHAMLPTFEAAAAKAPQVKVEDVVLKKHEKEHGNCPYCVR